jgi:hypothetical protein
MLGIKVYNSQGETHYLDLQPGASLSMEALMPAFNTELEEGEFSLPISVPMTAANRRFLGYPENFNTTSARIANNWRCDVYADGLLFLESANLRLLGFEGRMDGQSGAYSLNISGLMSHFGMAIKGKRLRELQLGGAVSWDVSTDCRTFAKKVMSDPNLDYRDRFAFVPVAIEDYFDTTRDDYNNEQLTNNTVNNIVFNPGFWDGWDFGVEDPMLLSTLIPSGTAGYEQHRTVPFFRLAYVLRQCFREMGWGISGSFFQLPEVENLLIFNNCSLEKYDPSFPIDSGRRLLPANHLPDLGIYEFLRAVRKTFNLKLVFSGPRQAQLNLCETVLNSARQVDYSAKALVRFEDATRNPMFEDGHVVNYPSTSGDNYWSDRVKDPEKLNVVATVQLYTDIPGLGLPSPDSSQFIYVEVENYYYNYNEQTARWEPYSEGLWERKVGKGDTQIELGFAPLCEHYAMDAGGAWAKQNKAAARMAGSYINGQFKLLQNDFGTRLFFLRLETTGSYTNAPRSYAHNYNADGTQIGPYGLSLTTNDGLYNRRWQAWLRRLTDSWDIKARLVLNNQDLSDISEQDLIQILQSQFILRRISYDLPLREPVQVELVKL